MCSMVPFSSGCRCASCGIMDLASMHNCSLEHEIKKGMLLLFFLKNMWRSSFLFTSIYATNIILYSHCQNAETAEANTVLEGIKATLPITITHWTKYKGLSRDVHINRTTFDFLVRFNDYLESYSVILLSCSVFLDIHIILIYLFSSS
jgi:hypothetical protein